MIHGPGGEKVYEKDVNNSEKSIFDGKKRLLAAHYKHNCGDDKSQQGHQNNTIKERRVKKELTDSISLHIRNTEI